MTTPRKPTSTIHQTHGFPFGRLCELAYQRAKDLHASVLIEMEDGQRFIVEQDGQVYFA
jgi:hypothetical protein